MQPLARFQAKIGTRSQGDTHPWGYAASGEMLSPRQERELSVRAQAGDLAAQERIVRANIPLVHSIAGQYRSPYLETEDLVQEGMIGLCIAISRFDPGRGCRFTTYAIPWIRQRVFQALHHQARLIRVPVEVQYAARRADTEADRLAAELGRIPTDDELAAACGISPHRFQAARHALQHPVDEVPPGEDSDPDARDPIGVLLDEEERTLLYRLLGTLSGRERAVLEARFGLGRPRMEPSELAAELSVTPEAVRQIRRRALLKLRRRWKLTELLAS